MGGRKGGRKPIPTAIHILQGGKTKTHRPLPPHEPKPKPAIPSCPRHMPQEARKEWRRVMKELAPLRMITHLDRAIVADYCHAWAEWVEASELIKKSGTLVKGSGGIPQVNPLYRRLDSASQKMRAAMTELGMTPSSRVRVKTLPEAPAEENRKERFFK